MAEPIDTGEMLAIHETLRKEFAALPLLVKGVGVGDSERAGIVGRHVDLLLFILERHHLGEDELVWPKLQERCPDELPLVETMEAQHEAIHGGVDKARAENAAWMADPSELNRAALHTSLIALERSLLDHLGLEESKVLPLIGRTFTVEEFAALGEHARSALDPQQMSIALGMILDHVPPQFGELILGSMPPEARQGFENFGRPAYASYRERLLATA